jgi:metal-dependent HD superfamily phosphatase/phosphodiesterase
MLLIETKFTSSGVFHVHKIIPRESQPSSPDHGQPHTNSTVEIYEQLLYERRVEAILKIANIVTSVSSGRYNLGSHFRV